MFSKTKINDPTQPERAPENDPAAPSRPVTPTSVGASGHASKAAPSIISQDLAIIGDLNTDGDMQIEGRVEGNIRSHLLTIGQDAFIQGQVVADDVVVHGRVEGSIRGEKIRLSANAQVIGDILHKNIAIESGAQFEGSVQRSDDPTNDATAQKQLPGPVVRNRSASETTSVKPKVVDG